MKQLKTVLLLGIILFNFSCERNEVKQQSTLEKAEIVFNKTFPEITETHSKIIVGKNDDFYLIGCKSIVSFNALNNIKWIVEKSCVDLVPTDDGGCVITFVESGTNYYNRTFHLAKLNENGTIEWEKTGNDYQLSRITIGNNNEILGVGDVNGLDGFSKPKFFRYSSEGNLLFSKFLTNRESNTSYQSRHIFKLTNGNLIVGTLNSLDSQRENFDFNIFEFDVEASNITEKHYGGFKNEFLTDIKELPNNELVLVGISESKDGDIKSWREELTLQHGIGNAWIVKLDANRDIVWEKIMGGSEGAWFAKILYKNDNLFIAYETSSTDVDFNSPEKPKFGIVTFDNYGNIKGIKYIEGSVIWSGEAGCAYDSKGNLIMLSGIYDEYYGNYTLRILKIR